MNIHLMTLLFVSEIMKLCDYDVAKKSKFIAYTCSVILIGYIAFSQWSEPLGIGKVLAF